MTTTKLGVTGLGYGGPNIARNFATITGCEERLDESRREQRAAV